MHANCTYHHTTYQVILQHINSLAEIGAVLLIHERSEGICTAPYLCQTVNGYNILRGSCDSIRLIEFGTASLLQSCMVTMVTIVVTGHCC